MYGWRALFFLAGGIGFAWLGVWAIVYRRPEEARWLGEAERAKILAERGGRMAKEVGPSPERLGLARMLRSGPTLWGLALTQGCNVYSQYLFLTWLPSYLQNQGG